MNDKIYLRLYYIDENTAEVVSQNHKPFHGVYGIGKTESELLEHELLVDSIPKPINIKEKQAKLMYDKKNNKLYYDYVDIAPTIEQQVAIDLMQQNAAIIFALVKSGLM